MPNVYNPQESSTSQEPVTYGQTGAPGGSLLMSVVGAAGGAAVGAGIWMLVGYLASLEIGYIAILVGALAGWGAVLLGKTQSPTVGVISAVAGLAGVVAGSYGGYCIVLHSDDTRQTVYAGMMDTWHGMTALEFIGQADADRIAEESYQEDRDSGDLPAATSLDEYRKKFRTNLRRMKADKFVKQMPEQDRAALMDEVYQQWLSSDDVGYLKLLTEDVKETAFLILFAGLGLFYGFRVGVGKSAA